jgi:hypothetical protein
VDLQTKVTSARAASFLTKLPEPDDSSLELHVAIAPHSWQRPDCPLMTLCHWPFTRDQLALRLVCLSARAQTIPELKELCTRYQLPKTVKKQDLIDSLVRHLGGGSGGGGSTGAGLRGDDDGGGGGNKEVGGAERRNHHGHILCHHNRKRKQCRECRGGSICEHGRRRNVCKECGGSSICEHGRQRNVCKECSGSSICAHGRIKYRCKDCKATKGEAAAPAVVAQSVPARARQGSISRAEAAAGTERQPPTKRRLLAASAASSPSVAAVKLENKHDQHSESKHQQGLVRLQKQQGQELEQLKQEQHQRASARAQWEQEAARQWPEGQGRREPGSFQPQLVARLALAPIKGHSSSKASLAMSAAQRCRA